MCRLLGYLGPAGGSAEPWLVSSERSLLRQSDADPKGLQEDGWGIAWYSGEDATVSVTKGVHGAHSPDERERFMETARARARGPLVIGHLRHASNPLKLPREALLSLENSQPFTFEGLIFAHNGSIPLPTETRSYLGRLDDEVKGVNDSEVLFLLLAHHLEKSDDPLRAYADTVGSLNEVWDKAGAKEGHSFSGLNVLFSRSPDELWAFCLAQGEHGCGLMARDLPYYQMTYRTDRDVLVVGSEPFDNRPQGWQPLLNGTYLNAERIDGHLSVRTGRLSIPMSMLPTT
ncbi:MAG: class II glutamine amidotransferase [Thermoplasmata archaeon]